MTVILMTINSHPLGLAIRLRRVELGWDQRALAKAAKVSPRAVSQIETGAVDPRASTIHRLITALGGRVEVRYEKAQIQQI